MFTQKFCRCQIKHQKIDLKCCQRLESDFKTLGAASKISLILALEAPHCVCELMSLTGLSQTLISHHLSEFQEKGMVEVKQEGKFKRYFLTEKGKNFLSIIKSFI